MEPFLIDLKIPFFPIATSFKSSSFPTHVKTKFESLAVDWMRKDLNIAIDEAKKNNSPLPITKIIDGYYEEIQKVGGNRWDTSSLTKRFRKK